MDYRDENRPRLGQTLTTKWFSIPRKIRHVIVYGGLLLLIYFANKLIWF